MQFWQAIVLSAVEGVTEFLPISSTGHMILAAKLLSLSQSDFVKSFEIVIQLGAILAVFIMYGKRIVGRKKETMKIGAAFIPTAVIGFLLYKLIKQYLIGNSLVTAAALLVGGFVMIIFERSQKISNNKTQYIRIEDLSWKKSALIGLFQAIAVVPGVSRSLMTIIGGIMMGLSRKEAVEMSFILAIPTMAAATGYDLLRSGWSFSSEEWMLLFAGFIGAFVSAWAVVKWLLGYIQKHDFQAFGIYRIAVAVVFLALN